MDAGQISPVSMQGSGPVSDCMPFQECVLCFVCSNFNSFFAFLKLGQMKHFAKVCCRKSCFRCRSLFTPRPTPVNFNAQQKKAVCFLVLPPCKKVKRRNQSAQKALTNPGPGQIHQKSSHWTSCGFRSCRSPPFLEMNLREKC